LEEDKVAYALSYMTEAAQNWAMPILQALIEGCHHDLLISYDGFREAITTFIKRRARATLVSKGDIGGDSPSLARDEVKRTKSLDRLERCSTLIRMN